jgi:hypothetical protein
MPSGLAENLAKLTKTQLRAFESVAIKNDWSLSRRTAAILLKQGLIELYEEALPGWPPLSVKRYRVPLTLHAEWCGFEGRESKPRRPRKRKADV